MDIPDSLSEKVGLFRSTGKVFRDYEDLFTEIAWQQVMLGQGIIPEDHHTLVDALSDEQLNDLMANLKTLIDKTVERMPEHQAYLPK